MRRHSTVACTDDKHQIEFGILDFSHIALAGVKTTGPCDFWVTATCR